jgi:hypothetical protein
MSTTSPTMTLKGTGDSDDDGQSDDRDDDDDMTMAFNPTSPVNPQSIQKWHLVMMTSNDSFTPKESPTNKRILKEKPLSTHQGPPTNQNRLLRKPGLSRTNAPRTKFSNERN